MRDFFQNQNNDYIFGYSIGGHLTPLSSPFPEEFEEGQDNFSIFQQMGFSKDFAIESANFVEMEFLTNGKSQWIIWFSDGLQSCYVCVNGWPAMLDALARYTSLAQLAESVSSQLSH